MRAFACLAALLSSSCALIDAARGGAPADLPSTCNDAPNGCICSPDTNGSDSVCRPDAPVAGAFCCNEASTSTCACAVPACYIDGDGNCLCAVFADPDMFDLTPAPGNMCAASGENVVCCESFGSDYPSCTCGPECGPHENNVGSQCTPAAVSNCGALTSVSQCN